MFISDLDQMEKIVNTSRNLEWDGWNVIKYTPASNAMFSKDGVYKNNKWYKRQIFPITEQGWNMPDSVGKQYAQMER